MKHVYSGTELRSGANGTGGAGPGPEPRAPGGNGSRPGRGWQKALALAAVVLLAGAGAMVWWAWQGKKAEPNPLPYIPEPDFLAMGPLQAKQLYAFVKNSPHVQGNDHYRELLERVQFVYDEDENVVNAYAFAREEAGHKGARQLEIHCNAGATRFARLMALGLAAQQAGRENAVEELLTAMTPAQFGVLEPQDAANLLKQTGLAESLDNATVRRLAESIASGMLTFVFAHESGHQALGHVFGSAANLDVSRNQEREADTFASSVIATSPYGEYMFAGTLLWQYALAQQQTGSNGGGTHPLAKERLENLIQQNPEMAAAFGISAPKGADAGDAGPRTGPGASKVDQGV